MTDTELRLIASAAIMGESSAAAVVCDECDPCRACVIGVAARSMSVRQRTWRRRLDVDQGNA